MSAVPGSIYGMAYFSPEFCEKRCPICTRARKGSKVAGALQKVEMALTIGGCPWGRSRERRYGVRPNEALPVKDAEKP